MFNHLPPSSHEWQIYQSNSPSVIRLNRGSCCTPKFALSFLKESPWILKFAFIKSPGLELSIFPSKPFTRENGHLHNKKSDFDFWIKIKSQKSYFIKTYWNMKFVSSRNSKVKFYFGKVKF